MPIHAEEEPDWIAVCALNAAAFPSDVRRTDSMGSPARNCLAESSRDFLFLSVMFVLNCIL